MQRVWLCQLLLALSAGVLAGCMGDRDDDVAAGEQRRAIELCRLSGRYQPECIYAVVRNIAFDDGGRLSRAVGFCTTAPASTRAKCYRGLGTAVTVVEPTARKRVERCRRLVPSDYVGDCWVGVVQASPLVASSNAGRS